MDRRTISINNYIACAVCVCIRIIQTRVGYFLSGFVMLPPPPTKLSLPNGSSLPYIPRSVVIFEYTARAPSSTGPYKYIYCIIMIIIRLSSSWLFSRLKHIRLSRSQHPDTVFSRLPSHLRMYVTLYLIPATVYMHANPTWPVKKRTTNVISYVYCMGDICRC